MSRIFLFLFASPGSVGRGSGPCCYAVLGGHHRRQMVLDGVPYPSNQAARQPPRLGDRLNMEYDTCVRYNVSMANRTRLLNIGRWASLIRVDLEKTTKIATIMLMRMRGHHTNHH